MTGNGIPGTRGNNSEWDGRIHHACRHGCDRTVSTDRYNEVNSARYFMPDNRSDRLLRSGDMKPGVPTVMFKLVFNLPLQNLRVAKAGYRVKNNECGRVRL
jgi:hypothetical protein